MISKFNYGFLESDELFTFGTHVVSFFEGKTLEGSPLDFFVKGLKQSLQVIGAGFEHDSKNPYTQQLAAVNLARGRAFLSFRSYIESCCFCDDLPGYSSAGFKIAGVIRKHGWSAASLGKKAQTAALINISNELRDKFHAELTLTLATDYLTRMDNAQKKFEQLVESNVEGLTGNKTTVTETRPQLISSLKSLFNAVDLQNQSTPTADTKEYDNKINELITLTISTAKANETRQQNEKKKKDTKEVTETKTPSS